MADGGDYRGEVRYLAIQKNTDGRPCCWAIRTSSKAAEERAAAMWPNHGGSGCGCYPGEERGEIETHVLED